MKHDLEATRASTIQAAIEQILAANDGRIPANIEDVGDFANILLLRWHTRLSASIERGLANEPLDREDAVIEAWRHANWIYWGVRMVLDGLSENPPDEATRHAVVTTTRNDWAMMAVAAGLANIADERACRIGSRLEAEARRRIVEQRSTPRETRSPHLRETLTRKWQARHMT